LPVRELLIEKKPAAVKFKELSVICCVNWWICEHIFAFLLYSKINIVCKYYLSYVNNTLIDKFAIYILNKLIAVYEHQ